MECKNTIFAVASAVKMSQNGDFFFFGLGIFSLKSGKNILFLPLGT